MSKVFTDAELFDGVRKSVTLEQLENAGVTLCEGTRKAERFWLVQWKTHIEVMGSWNGDIDCINTVGDTYKSSVYQALKELY